MLKNNNNKNSTNLQWTLREKITEYRISTRRKIFFHIYLLFPVATTTQVQRQLQSNIISPIHSPPYVDSLLRFSNIYVHRNQFVELCVSPITVVLSPVWHHSTRIKRRLNENVEELKKAYFNIQSNTLPRKFCQLKFPVFSLQRFYLSNFATQKYNFSIKVLALDSCFKQQKTMCLDISTKKERTFFDEKIVQDLI